MRQTYFAAIKPAIRRHRLLDPLSVPSRSSMWVEARRWRPADQIEFSLRPSIAVEIDAFVGNGQTFGRGLFAGEFQCTPFRQVETDTSLDARQLLHEATFDRTKATTYRQN